MKYFIGNLKEHKTVYETVDWIKLFISSLKTETTLFQLIQNKQIKVIICPAMPYIFYFKQFLKELPEISIGTQDISQFDQGSHTGEISASMLKGSVEYSIVGHSERRAGLQETEVMIAKKIDQLHKNQIQSILCIRNETDKIYNDAAIVAFEPVEAIGNGKNMNAGEVVEMKKKFQLQPNQSFLYGGSVNSKNCSEYLHEPEIDGFLIGTSSLDALEFIQTLAQFKS